MSRNWKYWAKVTLICPIVFVWDLSFWLIKSIYDGAKWVDEKGGDMIDDFLRD